MAMGELCKDPLEESQKNNAPMGLIFDSRMCSHSNLDDESHPECPDRILAIWNMLLSSGIASRCRVFLDNSTPVDDRFVKLVHDGKHIDLVKNLGCGTAVSDVKRRSRVASRFSSIYLNEGSSLSAFLAAGSVLEVTEKVAKGELKSAIAIVRPPGHHAEHDKAMGFCLFNNVAIAASFLLNEKPELGVKKILIVDWDVHHGNGTQKMFWNDPRVLYFSVHRFDFGTFYPGGEDGSHLMIGEGLGIGYNINVPWEHGRCGDADYLAVWDHILLPVAGAYNPDIILISGGFDSAMGDPLGGCCVTPHGYFMMMNKLMEFAHGKIVLALEGGYNLNSLAKSIFACAKALLEEKPTIAMLDDQPFESTKRVIESVREKLSPHWPVLASELPQISTKKPTSFELGECRINFLDETIQRELTTMLDETRMKLDEEIIESSRQCTELEAVNNMLGKNLETTRADLSQRCAELVRVRASEQHLRLISSYSDDEDVEGTSDTDKDITVPFSMLSVGEIDYSKHVAPLTDETFDSSQHWRSIASKIYVWYGSYGSNMWTPRFLCYIRGGQAEGMKWPCLGSRDKSFPKDIIWMGVPHRLFFGRSHSDTWGAGGVCFLHPQQNINDNAYMCLHKITLEQFEDVLLQENCITEETTSPLLNYCTIKDIAESKSISPHSPIARKGGWYSNVLYLKKLDGIPILTMTCSLEDFMDYKSGKLPRAAPSIPYRNTLVKGLVEGKQLSEGEALDYLNISHSQNLIG